MKFDLTPNRRAMLDTIAFAEGTGDRYDLLFGYGTFDVNGPHPNVAVPFGDTTSTAAGRYQFLYSTWQDTIPKIPQPDLMVPQNQDQAALQRIKDRNALDDVDNGNIEVAINKLAVEWASFPGSPYGQPTKSMADMVNFFYARQTVHDVKKNVLNAGVAVMAIVLVAAVIWGGLQLAKG